MTFDLLKENKMLRDRDLEPLTRVSLRNIKDFAGNWDAVWDNILLRGKMKETLVNLSDKALNPDLLEAPFAIKCNDVYHQITEKIQSEVGGLDSKRIFYDWNHWLVREIKKKNIYKR